MPNSARMQWPYPTEESDPWFDAFADMVQAMDEASYSFREDRHAILAEGGVINWTAPTLSWAAALVLTAPITGFRWQVPAGNVDIADGETAYIVLSRGPLVNQNVVGGMVASSTVPSNNDTVAVCTRIGTKLYFRNGLFMQSTDAITDIGATQGGAASAVAPRTAPIIVGNSAAGDVASDADYLDVGDGTQLAAALAAAASGTEVYVRPGTYDLGAGAVSPFSVGANVRVRGAARGGTIIRTKALGDMSAFLLAADAQLVDIGIEVALPTGAGNTADYVVSLGGNRAMCERVAVTFLGAYGAPQATNLFIRGVFSIANTFLDCKLIDPDITTYPSLRANGVGADLVGYRVVGGTVAVRPHQIVRPRAIGGDISADLQNRAELTDPNFEDPDQKGVSVSVDGSRSRIAGGQIRQTGAAGTWLGIHLQGTITFIRITDVRVDATGGQSGILFDGTVSRCTVRGVHVESTMTNGLELVAGTTQNVAIGCILTGNTTPVNDLGTSNEVVAHNIVA